jgi:hypothetical protein
MAKTKTKPAPEEEVDEDVEELDEDAEEETAPKGKKDEVTFGVADLAKLLTKKTGKEITPRSLRVLLRKMARDGSNRIDREIVAGNRARYDWSGPDDPEVKRIIKAVTAGELEEGKKEALEKLKAQKAAKQAAKKAEAEKAEGKKGKGAKAAAKKAAPVEDDDDEEFEIDEDDE